MATTSRRTINPGDIISVGSLVSIVGPEQPGEDARDEIEKSMGVFGRYQILMAFLLYIGKFPIAWHNLLHVFLAPKVSFTCNGEPNKCSDNCTHEFNRSLFTETIITQFDLVCSREVFATLDQTIAMFGIMIGSITFGYLADKFGRKYPLSVAVLLQAILGICSAFSPWYPLFLVFRFLTTVTVGGMMVVSFVLLMELIGTKWRTVVGVLYQIPFNIGHGLLPVVSYFLRDWRYFLTALSTFSALLTLYFCALPESPRWLIAAQRPEQAVVVLDKAARYNKLPIALEEIKGNVNKYVEKHRISKTERGNYYDLIKTHTMRVYTICIGFNWFVCGLCFYGGAQYMKELGGSIFINQALAALMSAPGTFFSLWGTKALGRRYTLIVSDCLSGTACLLIAFLPSDPSWAKIFCAGVNMFALMGAFNTVYIYSGELFPTIDRNVGVGFCSMCARWGSMTAPFVADAQTLGGVPSFVPPCIFASVALIGAALTFLLPETLDCELPDTVEQAEAMKDHKHVDHHPK